MFDEQTCDQLEERISSAVIKRIRSTIEGIAPKQWPRWMSVETAGEYIDKTYEGMRYTLCKFKRELPVSMIGDKPRIDKNDIDKLLLNLKGKE